MGIKPPTMAAISGLFLSMQKNMGKCSRKVGCLTICFCVSGSNIKSCTGEMTVRFFLLLNSFRKHPQHCYLLHVGVQRVDGSNVIYHV